MFKSHQYTYVLAETSYFQIKRRGWRGSTWRTSRKAIDISRN